MAVDAALFSAVNGAHAPWLDHVMLALTWLGYFPTIWLVAGVALLSAPRLRAAALRLCLAVALSHWLASGVIKPLVGRPRPFVAGVAAARTLEAVPPASASFPSGHAATAAAGAIAGARLVTGAGPLLWALATAIAYSRVYVGVHFPSDVLAGALLGVCSAWLVLGGRHPSAVAWPAARGHGDAGAQCVP